MYYMYRVSFKSNFHIYLCRIFFYNIELYRMNKKSKYILFYLVLLLF